MNKETDCELLELAAKAAELPECGWMGPSFMYVKDNTFTDWNPLTDDGDALRLMVRLKIDVCWNNNEGPWEVNAWPRKGMGSNEDPSKDPDTATRRAITRAAAEIGRAMKGKQ